MKAPIPAIVLGGTGYVAGELLRLLAGHPDLVVAGVMSESQAGVPIRSVFPNLQYSCGGACFMTREEIFGLMDGGPMAVFSAAPHGASAGLIAQLLEQAAARDTRLTVVDVSADFRYTDAQDYMAVYEQPHGAPELLPRFACAVPEHREQAGSEHVAHPGCFATALLMAVVPLLQQGLAEEQLYACGITGSTGSGRSAIPSTHHPERHANLYAYRPLQHRHTPEVVGISEALTGRRPALQFVPHSGPFARGIHVTVQGRLNKGVTVASLEDGLRAFYAHSEFVSVCDAPPRIKDVVGSNYCHLYGTAQGRDFAVMVVIDNLIKGAAGGAVQWMNRQFGFAESAGLAAPGPAWI